MPDIVGDAMQCCTLLAIQVQSTTLQANQSFVGVADALDLVIHQRLFLLLCCHKLVQADVHVDALCIKPHPDGELID